MTPGMPETEQQHYFNMGFRWAKNQPCVHDKVGYEAAKASLDIPEIAALGIKPDDLKPGNGLLCDCRGCAQLEVDCLVAVLAVVKLREGLEAARAKFHGLSVAFVLAATGEETLDLMRVQGLLQAGNVAAAAALALGENDGLKVASALKTARDDALTLARDSR